MEPEDNEDKIERKRIEIKVMPDFFRQLEEYRNKYSMTMTAAIVTLCKKTLRDIEARDYELNHKKKEEKTLSDQPAWKPKNAAPKEVVVEHEGNRKIVKNEYADE